MNKLSFYKLTPEQQFQIEVLASRLFLCSETDDELETQLRSLELAVENEDFDLPEDCRPIVPYECSNPKELQHYINAAACEIISMHEQINNIIHND